MNIDLDHLHYWMCAIRESKDPIRTLDAFWRGQVDSKLWLIDNLKNFIDKEVTVDIHGGWVGVLASLLFQSTIKCSYIRSVDIDPSCEPVANMMNKGEEILGKFKAVTANMCDVISNADVVINTSCEHITQDQYDTWLGYLNKTQLILLQSNNYNIPEHVRIAKNLEEFEEQSALNNICFKGELTLPKYKRFMIIGYK